MNEPKRVFCKDCENLCRVGEQSLCVGDVVDFRTVFVERCRIADVTFDPVRGEIRTASDPAKRNANFDCSWFTPKGAERVRPTEPKKKPWWRFW